MAPDQTQELIEAADRAIADGQFGSREAVFAECIKYLQWRTEQIEELRQSPRAAMEDAEQNGTLSDEELAVALEAEFRSLERARS